MRTCPGTWLYSRLGDLANRVNVILGSAATATTPTTKPKEELSDGSFLVRVKISDLNIRTGAGLSYKVVGQIPPGTYTIVETKTVNTIPWGKLKSGVGWICLNYAERI